MNLADIRKKAGLATDTPQPPVDGAALEGSVDSAIENDAEGLSALPTSADFADILLAEGEDVDVAEGSMDAVADQCSAPELESAEDTADGHPSAEASAPVSFVSEPQPETDAFPRLDLQPWPEASMPAGPLTTSAAAEESPSPGPFMAYNPLAVLLAGRASLLEEADTEGDGGEVDASGDALLEYLCFRVSHELYAVNIMEIKEIIKPREWTEVPRAPHFVCGVISLRGVIIPVFDMRRRLGLPQIPSSGKERIVVVRCGDSFCGILVDEVVQVVRIPVTSIEPAPTVLEGIDRDFVLGIGRTDGTMLILLSLESVLNLTVV